LQALETLRFPLSGLKKRHIQPGRYATLNPKIFEKIAIPPSMAVEKA
jgi:hypothetical protein